MQFLSNPCICIQIDEGNLSVFIKFHFILLEFIFFQKLPVCISFVTQFLNLKTSFPFWFSLCEIVSKKRLSFFLSIVSISWQKGKKILLSRKLFSLASKSSACFVLKYRRQRSWVGYKHPGNPRKEKVLHCSIRCWNSCQMGAHGCTSSDELDGTVCKGENNLAPALGEPWSPHRKEDKNNRGCRITWEGFESWFLLLL